MNLTDAYVAGLFDGEGCISIHKRSARKDLFWVRTDVGMTIKAKPLLEAMQAMYGGTVKRHRAATDKWAEAWGWMTLGDTCLKLLKAMLPHLKIKKEQAEIGIAMQEMIYELGWTEETRIRALHMRTRMMELNKKGPSIPREDGSFARLAGGVWVTNQRDLFTDLGWESYSGTWPRRGTMRSGSVFALPTSARHTDASGCSLWPTPQAAIVGLETPEEIAARGYGPNLLSAAVHWPTPTSSEADKVSGPRRDGDRTLNGEAKKWNTPRSRDWKGDGKDCLPNQAKQWQTPNASVADAGARSRSGDRKDELLLAGQALQGVPSTTGNRRESFVLNAAWVATMMGLPADWLDGIEPPSKPSAIA